MNREYEVQTRYKKISANKSGSKAALYNPEEKEFSIVCLVTKSLRDHICSNAILNIEWVEADLIVISLDKFTIYRSRDKRILREIQVPGVMNVFVLKPCAYILQTPKGVFRMKKEVISKYSPGTEELRILDDNAVFIKRNGSLRIISSAGNCIFTKRILPKEGDFGIHIRNQKVYMLYNSKIIGHDLSLNVKGFKNVSYFKNGENFIFLFSSKGKVLYILRKDGSVFMEEREVDDFKYCEETNTLLLIKKSFFYQARIFNRVEIPFEYIDDYVSYLELEDEFDVSDHSHNDIELY